MDTLESVKKILEWNNHDNGSIRYLYRGVSDCSYDLIPKIGRNLDSLNEKDKVTEARKRYVKLQQYLSIRLPSYNFDFHHLDKKTRLWKEFFIAQHYGAPTSLLDFSRNPLVGLFFACQNSSKKNDPDAILYGIAVKEQELDIDEDFNVDDSNYNIATYDLIAGGEKGKSPNNLCKHKFVVPPQFDQRIKVQESVFCCFPVKRLTEKLDVQISENYEGGLVEPTQMDHIMSWKIDSIDKPKILDELNKIGVNHASLFPDINGLGEFLSWKLLNFPM